MPHHTSMPIKCVIERKTYVDVPGVYLVENLGIARVIVAHQFTVLNTEAIAPEGKMADRWVILCEQGQKTQYGDDSKRVTIIPVAAAGALGSGMKELSTSSEPSV